MVRVRFAPSPTGRPHPGNLRIAVLNHLMALKNDGKLILRIDDTDRERTLENGEALIIDMLRWLGIEWDEGPDIGGPFAPYRQSERLEIYEKYFQELVDRGLIYPCFCSEETIREMREIQKLRKEAPHYDGRCFHLSVDERNRLLESTPHVWRFRILDRNRINIHDDLRGDIEFSPVDLGGDFVVRRSNGLFTYNFTTVIDDHLMEITHIIRGEDHLSNTAKQIAIYDALGWEPPGFYHVPIMVDRDGRKLSKRSGEDDLRDLIEVKGILPEALYFYLAILGWHEYPSEPLFKHDLAEEFDISKIGAAMVRWNPEEVLMWNRKFMKEVDSARLVHLLRDFAREDFAAGISDGEMKKILSVVKENCGTLTDCGKWLEVFFSVDVELDDECKGILNELHELYECNPLDLLNDCINIGKGKGIGKKRIYRFIRCFLTGRRSGPPLGEIYSLMDRELLKKRWEKLISRRQDNHGES